jgi:ABC-type phosphate transport system auxiliary subunit
MFLFVEANDELRNDIRYAVEIAKTYEQSYGIIASETKTQLNSQLELLRAEQVKLQATAECTSRRNEEFAYWVANKLKAMENVQESHTEVESDYYESNKLAQSIDAFISTIKALTSRNQTVV